MKGKGTLIAINNKVSFWTYPSQWTKITEEKALALSFHRPVIRLLSLRLGDFKCKWQSDSQMNLIIVVFSLFS